MKPNRLFLIVLAFAIFTLYSTDATSQSFREEFNGFASPECVVTDGEFLYVSNLGAEAAPMLKDGDGFISRMTPEGVLIALKFLPGYDDILHAPKGMTVINRQLYVTDIDRVVGFDLDTRKQSFEIDLLSERTSFLNDLAVKDSNSLFVSATDIGKIFEINLRDGGSYSVIPLADTIRGPNGLYFDRDQNKLYVAGYGTGGENNGELGMVEFRSRPAFYSTLSEVKGQYDGIQRLDSVRLIISDWTGAGDKGTLRLLDTRRMLVMSLELPRSIDGPADFHLDPATNTVYIPAMLENKVLVHPLGVIPEVPTAKERR